MNIFGHIFKAGGKQLAQEAVEIAAGLSPETFTEAAISELEEKLEKATISEKKNQKEYDKEHDDVVRIHAIYNRKMVSLKSLAAQLADDPENAELKEGFAELEAEIKAMLPEIEREEQEEASAKALYEAFKESSESLAKQLIDARHQLDQIKRDMARAKQDKMNLAQQEEQAKVLAGIKKEATGFSSAMSAMQAHAEKEKNEADAARRRIDLLTQSSKKTENRYVAAAMKEAEGVESAPVSIEDRLAALAPKKTAA